MERILGRLGLERIPEKTTETESSFPKARSVEEAVTLWFAGELFRSFFWVLQNWPGAGEIGGGRRGEKHEAKNIKSGEHSNQLR